MEAHNMQVIRMMNRVPQQLVVMVIDFLHEEHETLRNCSLVCRAWLPSCRVHLFWSVHTGRDSWLSIDAFGRNVQRRPHIGRYIRDLEVVLAGPDEFGALIPAAQHLGNVKELTLYWGNLPIPQIATLSGIGPLRNLVWHGSLVAVPTCFVEAFTAFGTLRELYLDIDNYLDQGNRVDFRPLAAAIEPLPLEYVRIHDAAIELFVRCQERGAFGNMTAFEYMPSWPEEKPHLLPQALSLAAQNLRKFILCTAAVSLNPEKLDMLTWRESLRLCRQLDQLQIYAESSQAGFYPRQFQLLVAPCVNRIDLVLDLYESFDDLLEMGNVADALQDQGRLPSLRQFCVIARIWFEDRDPEHDAHWRNAERVKRESFARSQARGVFVHYRCCDGDIDPPKKLASNT